MAVRLAILLVVLASLSATECPAAAKPVRCPGGRFLPTIEALPILRTVGGGGALAFDDTTLSLGGACPPARAKVRAMRRATAVAARWPACGDVRRLRLKARIEAPDCTTMRGTLRARRSPVHAFTAVRFDPAALPTAYEFLAVQAAAGDPLQATTEVTTLVEFASELWASTSQWMAPSPIGGAVLQRSAADGPWNVVIQTNQLRVMGLAAFTIVNAASDPTEVLLGQAQPAGSSREIRWSVAPDRSLSAGFVLSDTTATVRAFGAHVGPAGAAFYAGVQPTGILRGAWNPDARTIHWSDTPELVVPGAGLDQKVTGFASCGGAIWATVRGTLYRRRTDASVDPVTGGPWQPVWTVAVANPDNSGLRGVTCIAHDGGSALLFGVEGSGEILRVDGVDGFGPFVAESIEPTLEVSTPALITDTLRAWGHQVPSIGPGAVGYVIPAYNDFTAVGDVWLAGVEWSYAAAGCPATRRCQPQRTFDAQACILRRATPAGSPLWELRCLAPPPDVPTVVPDPVPGGAALVAVRALRPAPWAPDELWLAGYDANFVPSIGTGWVARMPIAALRD